MAVVATALTAGTHVTSAWSAEPGTAGFLSLRLGTGARYSAMGDVGVSLARDATAAYWNPANLTSVETTSLALQHNEWIASVRVESFSLAHATDLGVFGVHFSGLYMDEIERRSGNSTIPEGFFNVYEIAVQGAWGHHLLTSEKLGKMDFGVGVKGLFSGLDDETARGWAVDAGVRLHTRIEGLTLAAAGHHLGPDLTFIEEGFKLPATFRAGADFTRPLPRWSSDFTLAYDLERGNDDDFRNHFGAEFDYLELIAVRGGFKRGFDTQGATFGVGFRKAGYRFDYSFADVSDDLGNAHRFSVGIDL
jgi:hypothetical protein